MPVVDEQAVAHGDEHHLPVVLHHAAHAFARQVSRTRQWRELAAVVYVDACLGGDIYPVAHKRRVVYRPGCFQCNQLVAFAQAEQVLAALKQHLARRQKVYLPNLAKNSHVGRKELRE